MVGSDVERRHLTQERPSAARIFGEQDLSFGSTTQVGETLEAWADVVGPVNTTVFKELELASVVLKGFFAFQQKLSLHRNTGLVTKIEIEKREIRI